MSIMDNMNAGGIPLSIESPEDEEIAYQEGKKKRMFLAGGPWNPMFPLGMIPVDDYEEEEDPNP